jgi:hypothetical protein
MLTLLVLVAFVVPLPDPEPPTEAKVREAVARSLVYLQEEAVDWVHDRKCASCHHAPMMIWAVSEARDRGFKVDQAALDEVTAYTLNDPVASKMLPAATRPGDKAPSGPVNSLPSAYAALASAVVPAETLSPAARASRRRLEAYLAEQQKPEGSWVHGGGRPPMLESEEVITLMTLLALTAPGQDGESPAAASRRKAAEWLKKTAPGGGLQAQVLRLLVAIRSGTDAASLADKIELILRQQRADGGWAQAAGLPSDAFATGQALYVLSLAGVKPDRPEVGRARGFLVASQGEDGAWPMTSRPVVKGGTPAKDLRPITFAATAWATLALVRSGHP